MPEAGGPHRGALFAAAAEAHLARKQARLIWAGHKPGCNRGQQVLGMSLMSFKILYKGSHRGALAAAAEAHLARKQCSLLRAGCRKLESARGQQQTRQHFPAGGSHEVACGRRHGHTGQVVLASRPLARGRAVLVLLALPAAAHDSRLGCIAGSSGSGSSAWQGEHIR